MLSTIHNAYRKFNRSTLLKSGVWYTGGMIAQKALVFLTIPLFTQLLSVEEYGTVFIFMTWLTVFSLTNTLNLHWSVRTARFDFDETAFRTFNSAVTVLGVASAAVFIPVLMLLADPLSGFFTLDRSLIIAAGLGAMLMVPLNMRLETWRILKDYRKYTLVSLVLEGGKIALALLFIWLGMRTISGFDRAVGRIAGILVVVGVMGTVFFWQILKAGRTIINRVYWRYALRYGVPLIPHSLSGVILAQFDRVMIDQYFSRGNAGVYSFAYQLGETISLLIVANNSAWAPWFYERMEAGDQDVIRRRARQYLLGFAGLTVLAMLVGTFIVPFITPRDYWAASALIPVIMAAGFVRLLQMFYMHLEMYAKVTGYISISTMAAAAVNVGLNLVLLPRYGYEIAVWTTLVSYIALFFFHALIVRLKMRMPDYFDLRLQVVMGVLMIGVGVGFSAFARAFLVN